MEQKDWRGETVILMSKSKTYLNKPRNSYREALFLYFSFVNKENDIGSYILKKKKMYMISRRSTHPLELVPRARAFSVTSGLTRGKAKILQTFFFSALKLQAKNVFVSQRETISKMLCEDSVYKC